ncbi:MAG: hypothetical protein CUN55_03345 [Phototrophicales bacterium]|nr:MAG: hypothetical protein CUN55_03345 [Phototrophicales bacterium]
MSYSYPNSSSPSPLLIGLVGLALVFGGYLLWTGFLNWLDEGSANTRAETATIAARSTSTFDAFVNQPTLVLYPTSTPIPPCEYFVVRGPQAAFVRECPDTSCKDITFIEPNETVCVIGRAQSEEFPNADDWYEVLLDPDAFLPEVSYMNEITLRALNPTPTMTPTFEPLPTITPVPSRTLEPTSPTIEPSPSAIDEDDNVSF